MSQKEKMDKTKECAEIVRNVMKENGKEISDYDLVVDQLVEAVDWARP